jgi:8-oxo-dGTP pyrophosphatase MutT (NUDIX family)
MTAPVMAGDGPQSKKHSNGRLGMALQPSLRHRDIVAAVIVHGGLICLLRRSAAVNFDRGKWHCVTGYLDLGAEPLGHAMAEIKEETGLTPGEHRLVNCGRPLLLPGGGSLWHIHTYLFEVTEPVLRLNWENDAYRWMNRADLAAAQAETVAWLADVLDALDVDRISARTGTARSVD